MYGYLTIEDADKLYEQGFCITLDADTQMAIIKNDELEYAEYLLTKIDIQSLSQIIGSIVSTIINALKDACKLVGQALIKIGSDE